MCTSGGGFGCLRRNSDWTPASRGRLGESCFLGQCLPSCPQERFYEMKTDVSLGTASQVGGGGLAGSPGSWETDNRVLVPEQYPSDVPCRPTTAAAPEHSQNPDARGALVNIVSLSPSPQLGKTFFFQASQSGLILSVLFPSAHCPSVLGNRENSKCCCFQQACFLTHCLH